MTQPDNFIPQDAISVSEDPAVTALSVIAEKTQQDWEDELAGPYTTKINPLLTWVTNLDLTEILQRLGALDGVEALIAAFQDALEPLLDPLTAALLNCNGASTATNTDQSPLTRIDDQSPLNANWTCAGNAKLSTLVKKFGDSSLLLDGSGDYIYPTAAASSFAWGQSDFTIEMWAYTTSVGTLQTLYDSGGGLSPRLQFSNSKLIYSVNGQVAIQGTTTLSGSTWYHVAVSREGDTTRLFLNGQQQGPDWTDETNYVNTANRPRIGLNVDGIHGFVGNIDSIRLTRLCRYTKNFTPPAAQFTQSLLSYFGEIVENLGRVTFTAGANILDFLVTDIGVGLVETIMNGLKVIAAIGDGIFTVLAKVAQWLFEQPVIENTIAVLNQVIGFFAGIIQQVGGLSLWNNGLAAVTALLQLVGNIVGQTFESVNNALEYFAGEGTFIGQLAANITGIALNLISDPFDAIANWADTLPPLFDTVTVAILNGNGANNTTVIDDQSPLNADWDAKGNTKISTGVKKYGTGSMLFDGTGDYIEPTTALSSFAWGNRDFTIEMWIYRTSLNANEMLWDAGASALKIDANKLVWVVDGQTRIQGATNLNINTWYHVAVCRSGTQTRLWLNGNLQGSAWTDATDYSAQSVRIGLSTTGTLGFTGNIDSVRLTKGLGRYPNRFTPPSAEFLPAILNNIPIIGPILEGITGIVGAGLQDLIDFFDGITGGAGSFLAQLVSAITGDAINLITSPLEALGTFFAGLPEIFEFFSGVIESVFDALDVTIERVIDVFKAVVEIIVGLFAGFPDFAAMLTYLRNSLLRILAAIGIISGEDGAEFSLQMIFDGIVDFFENIPLIGPIITALTGGATLDGKPVTDLGMLAQWFFQNVLRVDSLLPADNLRGVLPWFLLPKIPVGHIDGSTPNLLEQTGFTQAAVMQQGGRWSWDSNIGSGAAKVTAASAAAFLYSNAVSVSEGQQFTISAQVQYSNLTWNPLASPVMLGLRLYNDGQIVQSNQPVVYAPSIGLGTQNFFLLTGNYTIPAGVDTVRMSVGVTQSASSGTVWFDDVVMRKTGLLDQGLVGELINAWNGLVDGLSGSQQGSSNLTKGTGPGLYTPSSGARQAASTAYTTATGAQTAADGATTKADTAQSDVNAVASAGTNLMLSPSFDDTTVPRLWVGPAQSYSDPAQGHPSKTGTRSIRIVQSASQNCGIYLAPTRTSATLLVKENDKYQLEAWVYPSSSVASTAGGLRIGANYGNSKTGATQTFLTDVALSSLPADTWSKISYKAQVAVGYDRAQFFVYTTTTVAANKVIFVDDVIVREITLADDANTAAADAAGAANAASGAAAGALGVAQGASGAAADAQTAADTAQKTSDTRAQGGSNLVLSPTFDDTTITRIPFTTSSVTQGYSDPALSHPSRSGTRSWRWVQRLNTNCGLFLAPTTTQRTFKVRAGEKYFVEGWIRPQGTFSAGQVLVGATFKDSKGALADSTQSTAYALAGAGALSTASFNQVKHDVATVPSGYDTAEFWVYSTSATTANNIFYLDDVTVREITDAKAALDAAVGASGAAATAQTTADGATGGVQTTLNNTTIGLGGVVLNGSSATAANLQAAATATREALATLQSKISALQTNNSTFSGKAFFEDFSNYAASNNGFGGNWLSPLYTAVGNSSGTVGIETTSGAARAAWIGSGLDRRRAIVLYGSTLGTGDDSVQAVREANDYQRVGAVLSSSLTSGPNYIFARANSTATIGIYAKLVVNNLFDNGTAEIYALTNTGWPGSRIGGPTSFTHIPGSTYWLECGVGAGVRRHRLFRDNFQIIDTSTDAVSILPSSLGASAASYRYHGVGLEANANSLFRFEPADVAGYAAYDNKPLPTLGSGMRITRTSTALQPLIADSGAGRIVTAWNAAPDRITSDLSYNSTTGEVTVSVAGWYFVEVGLQFNAVIANNNNVAAACFRNGTIHSVGHHQWGTSVASFGTRAAGSWVVYCEAGNRLAGGYSSSSTFTNSLTGDATNSRTYFSVTFMSNLKPTKPT